MVSLSVPKPNQYFSVMFNNVVSVEVSHLNVFDVVKRQLIMC